MRQRRPLALSVVFVLLWLGAVRIGWAAGISIEGPLALERNVQRAETYSGVVTVRNNGDDPIQVKLYQTDYAFAADGSNDFGAPGRLPRSNAGWAQLDQEQYTIPPKGKVNAQYRVRVPDDATLAGSYWSVIMVEPLSTGEASGLPATKKGEAQVGLTQVVRYAVQVVTEIGDSGSRELELRSPAVAREGNLRVFQIDVVNGGERLLKPKLLLELNDSAGGAPRKLSAPAKRIYPGSSVRFRIDLGTVPAGRYRALVAADAGRDDLFGAEFEVTLR